jgi:hypothetical protein
MDIAEKMAADIALAIDGGDWQDAKWFSKFHREAWIKAVKPYADEIERLRKEVDELKDLMQATVNYTGASVSSTNYTFHAALEENE